MGRGAESHGFEWMAGCCWQSLADMGEEGLLSRNELLRMTCPSAGRSVEQIEAPFAEGSVVGLRLAHVSVAESPDPFWDAYCRTGDLASFGRSWAMIMRAANGPNFVAGLDPRQDAARFLDAWTDRMIAHIVAQPQRSRSYIVIVALEKVAVG